MAQKTAPPTITSATIDVDIVIQKYNNALEGEQPLMTRESLAKMLPVNKQIFTNWKSGITPNYLDSIFDLFVFIDVLNRNEQLLADWEPSGTPTLIDHIIKLMQIGKCPMSHFVTRSQSE